MKAASATHIHTNTWQHHERWKNCVKKSQSRRKNQKKYQNENTKVLFFFRNLRTIYYCWNEKSYFCWFFFHYLTNRIPLRIASTFLSIISYIAFPIHFVGLVMKCVICCCCCSNSTIILVATHSGFNIQCCNYRLCRQSTDVW